MSQDIVDLDRVIADGGFGGTVTVGTIPVGDVGGDLKDSPLTVVGVNVFNTGGSIYSGTFGGPAGNNVNKIQFLDGPGQTKLFAGSVNTQLHAATSITNFVGLINVGDTLMCAGSHIRFENAAEDGSIIIDSTNVTAGNKTQELADFGGTIAVWGQQVVTLSADNTAIVVAGSQILLGSDSGTATDRTFSLSTTGVQGGQRVTIRFVSANQAELVASATNETIDGTTLTFNATKMTVTFEYDSTNTLWFQATPIVTTAP